MLNANKNTYNWYSKQEYGNTINFIQNEKGLDFIDAVKYLNNEEFQVANFKEEKVVYDSSKYKYKEKEDMAVSRDYLINKRMLNEDLVNQLIEQDYIKEDKMKMYVSNGKIKMGKLLAQINVVLVRHLLEV